MRVLQSLVLAALLLGGVGCSTTVSGTPGPARGTPAAPAGSAAAGGAAAAAGAASGADCPLTAADLSSATAWNWQLRQTEADRPLETLESVQATMCVFTTTDRPQQAGDPLVLRVDTVTGADAAALRRNFEQTCTGARGAVQASAAAQGAAVCRRDGSVVEGNIAGADRAVDIYAVQADRATAGLLTASFDKVLAAVD